MGIKAIKAITNPASSQPVAFDYQGMVHVNKREPINKYFQILKKIGEGTFGEVFIGESLKTKHKRAIKKINTLKFPKAKSQLLIQIELLKNLDHPSILKIYQIFEEPQYSYIVTELCEGRELFDIVIEKKHFSQAESCLIFYDLVMAVRCMHHSKIMHRDLKPENIMYDETTKSLKVIDFGSGVKFQSSQSKPRKRVGTSYYIAPEVLKRFYNEKCDIWSLGVILFILLSGEPPFSGDDDFKIIQSIEKGAEVAFKQQIWKKISPKAKDLIKSMMERNVEKRLDILQVMKSPWIHEHIFERNTPLAGKGENSVAAHLKNMQNYKDIVSSPLQQGILIFIVNFVKDKKDEREMISSFRELDLNKDGVISLQELQKGMSKYLKVDEKKGMEVARKIFEKVDINRSGSIDFSGLSIPYILLEFVMSATNIEITVSESNLDIAFDYIDEDRSGKLSVSEIRQKLGNNVTEEQYEKLLYEFDKNSDGEISREEFKNMMKVLVQRQRRGTF